MYNAFPCFTHRWTVISSTLLVLRSQSACQPVPAYPTSPVQILPRRRIGLSQTPSMAVVLLEKWLDRRRRLRRVCSLKGWKDEGKWIKAAQDLNLTADQQKRALALRTATLTTLQR